MTCSFDPRSTTVCKEKPVGMIGDRWFCRSHMSEAVPALTRAMSRETQQEKNDDQGGHESHGGRDDLGPTDRPQLSHDEDRDRDTCRCGHVRSYHVGGFAACAGFRLERNRKQQYFAPEPFPSKLPDGTVPCGCREFRKVGSVPPSAGEASGSAGRSESAKDRPAEAETPSASVPQAKSNLDLVVEMIRKIARLAALQVDAATLIQSYVTAGAEASASLTAQAQQITALQAEVERIAKENAELRGKIAEREQC